MMKKSEVSEDIKSVIKNAANKLRYFLLFSDANRHLKLSYPDTI